MTITADGEHQLAAERQRRSAWTAQAIETRLTPQEREALPHLLALLEKLSRQRMLASLSARGRESWSGPARPCRRKSTVASL